MMLIQVYIDEILSELYLCSSVCRAENTLSPCRELRLSSPSDSEAPVLKIWGV